MVFYNRNGDVIADIGAKEKYLSNTLSHVIKIKKFEKLVGFKWWSTTPVEQVCRIRFYVASIQQEKKYKDPISDMRYFLFIDDKIEELKF